MSRGERTAILVGVGLSLASICGVVAVTLNLFSQKAWVRAQTQLYEERLAHMQTRYDLHESRLDAVEAQLRDLWEHHRAAMQVDSRLAQSDAYQDNLLLQMDSALYDAFFKIKELEKSSTPRILLPR